MSFIPVWSGRLALVLSAFFSSWAAAEPARMTADQAVEHALSRGQWQQEWQAGVDLARGDLALARTQPNPSIVASREDLAEAGATGEETTVLLSQSFDLGGVRGLHIRAAEAGLAVAEVQALRDRRQVRSETLLAYYRVVAAEQLRAIRAEALAELEQIADAASKRHAEGDLSGFEAKRLQQSAEQARAAHADAESEVHVARAALAAWVGSSAASAVLDDTLPPPELPAATDVGSANLDVLTAEQARAEAELEAARRLSLPVTVGVGRKRVRLGNASDDTVVLEFGVALPLFDRQQGERARASAALSLAESRREREEATLQVTRSALMAQAQARIAAVERVNNHLRPEAIALSAIAKASFSEGELEVFALLDALESNTRVAEQSTAEGLRALEAVLALEALMPVQP